MLNAKLMEDLIQRADEAGVRLEIVGGLPLWESHPVLKHQEESRSYSRFDPKNRFG